MICLVCRSGLPVKMWWCSIATFDCQRAFGPNFKQSLRSKAEAVGKLLSGMSTLLNEDFVGSPMGLGMDQKPMKYIEIPF